MRIIFENEDLKLQAEGYSTRNSWGHKAQAVYQGRIVAEKKIRYYNRTWERYTFESILGCLIDKLDRDKVVPLKDRLELSRLINA